MKKKKSLLLLILAIASGVIFTFEAQAQKKFSYGVKAGLNLSKSTFTPYSYEEKSPKAGFQVGFTGDYNLIRDLFLQSELMFTTKGVVYKGSEVWIGSSNPPVTHWKNTIDQLYVQVPLKLAYKINIGANTRAFVNAGYYASYGVAGNDKLKNQFEGVDRPDENKTRLTYEESLLKRFDDGISTGIGIEYKTWSVGINYESGFKDLRYMHIGSSETYSYKNRNVSFTIGYRLF